MTEFDKILKAAFEAGRECGLDEAARDAGYFIEKPAPDFEEWRATLSGLDVRPDLGPIRMGDTVEVTSSDPLHAPAKGRRGVVVRTHTNYVYVEGVGPYGSTRCIHVSGVTKVHS